jgi:hypothetical protein
LHFFETFPFIDHLHHVMRDADASGKAIRSSIKFPGIELTLREHGALQEADSLHSTRIRAATDSA